MVSGGWSTEQGPCRRGHADLREEERPSCWASTGSELVMVLGLLALGPALQLELGCSCGPDVGLENTVRPDFVFGPGSGLEPDKKDDQK